MPKTNKHGFSKEQINSIADQMDAVGNNAWADLERVYLECRAVSVTPAQVLPLLRDPEQLKKVSDIGLLTQQSKILGKDISVYNERLAAIHSKHADKKGNADDPDELMTILTIGEEYQDWLISFQLVVSPTIQSILEMFSSNAIEGDFIPANSEEGK